MIISKYIKRVVASCGHEGIAVIPPHDMRRGPGPVGMRKIKQAQSEPCFDCRVKEERLRLTARPTSKPKITFIIQGE